MNLAGNGAMCVIDVLGREIVLRTGSARRALLFVLSVSFALLWAPISHAAVINALSASRNDVGNAVAAAADGDTVNIPAGNVGWSTGLSINKAITLQGAGIGQTIIRDDIPYPSNPQGVFTVTLVANKFTRITGIELTAGTRSMVTGGHIQLIGSNLDNRRVRVDHCRFNNLRGFAFTIDGALGVIDHNVVLFNQQVGFAYVRHANFNGSAYGDGSYAAGDMFGSDQFIFFEDNQVTCTLPGWHLTTVDGYGGSRFVFRYNTLTKGSLEVHGTESGGRNRGGRAMEVYKNNFVGDDSGGIVTYFRSGVGVIYSNNVTGYAADNAPLHLLNARNDVVSAPFSVGNAENAGADGKNPWDVNKPGGPFGSGTASGTAATKDNGHTITMAVSGVSWTPGQWVGYSITRTSGQAVTSLTRNATTATVVCPGHGLANGQIMSIMGANEAGYNHTTFPTVVDANTFTYPIPFGASSVSPASGSIKAIRGNTFSEVVSNTANTITFRASTQGPEYYLRFDAGDTFQFWKVEHAMDQCGRIGGSLVSGDKPTRPATWNNQTTSPWYEWNNTRENGIGLHYRATHLTIRENEHFINNTPKPGYQPFTYPHPLVSGNTNVTTTVAIPSNLHIVSP